MKFCIVRQKIENSLSKLIEEDNFLIRNDVSERSIVHKLASYINEEFSGYDVDCEYNSNVENDKGKKYIYFIRDKAAKLGLIRERDADNEVIYRIVYPDIIVHKRGRNDSNFLIVEVKKSSSRISSDYDREKLTRYTSSEDDNELHYRYGVFILVGVKEDTGVVDKKWFVNGRCQDIPEENNY